MDSDQFFRIAKALSDPRRFEIFETVVEQEECGCSHLCGQFDVTQPTISHHLKELVTAGLLESRREGQFVLYRPRPEVLTAYTAELRRRLPALLGGLPVAHRG